MPLRILIFFFLNVISITVMGQGSIQGQILDSKGQPIAFADVVLHQSRDSSIITSTLTNSEGQYELETSQGIFIIQIRMLSYETQWSNPIVFDNEDIIVPPFTLLESATQLQQVVIEGQRNQMELKLDRRVYNVEKDLSNIGGNATNILENLPSVTIDIDGNVSLRGSENVRILINGKPSGLIGSDNQGLRQLQASMIEKVEVITNPSAKYEAEGEAGIINIVLKKQIQRGINGSIDINTGYPENLGIGVNLNRRKEKFNLFTNIGVNYRKSPGGGSAKMFFYDQDSTIFETERTHIRSSKSARIRIGGDYFFNPKSTLTLSGTYRFSDGENNTDITYTDLNIQESIIGKSMREDREEEVGNEIEFNTNYKSIFSSKDHFLEFNISFQKDGDIEKSTIDQTILQGIGVPLFQRVDNTEDQQRTLLSATYEHPMSAGKKLEAGLNSSLRLVDNSFLVETRDDQGNWEVDDLFNNQMEYQENIHAAYAIFSQEQEKWSYQLGLRSEYSDITTRLTRTDEENPRDYIDFFPSAHFSWNLSEKDQLQLSYSRRISRPRFRHLLPFYSFSDNRNYWGGNPNLNPEYSNNSDLGYLKYFEEGSLLTSFYYRHRTDIIQRITILNVDNVTETIPINLGTAQTWGLELSFNYNLQEWLRLTANFNGFHMMTEGEYKGDDLSAETYSMSTRWSLRAQLKKGWTVQSTINYLAPEKRPQGTRLGFFSWDVGMSKEILNKRGTITFGIRDVLNSRKWQSETEGSNFYRESSFQWRVRSFNLGFNYLINKDRKKSSGRSGGYQGGTAGEGF